MSDMMKIRIRAKDPKYPIGTGNLVVEDTYSGRQLMVKSIELYANAKSRRVWARLDVMIDDIDLTLQMEQIKEAEEVDAAEEV